MTRAEARDRIRVALNAIHLSALIGLAVFGVFFDNVTGGLVYRMGGEYHPCAESDGSMADDAEALLLFGVMLVPAALRLVYLRRHITLTELLLVAPIVLVSTIFLSEVGCGWDNLTVEAMGFPWRVYIYTLLWAYPLSAFSLMFVRWPDLII